MLNSKKSTDILQKKIPKNPKYEKIGPTIDTGASLSRYMKKIEEIKQNYRIRKDELFKRMKVTTFVQLVLQVAEINHHLYFNNNNNNNDSQIPEVEEQTDPEQEAGSNVENDKVIDDKEDLVSEAETVQSNQTQRSTFQGLIRGVGELDVAEDNTDEHDDLRNGGSGDGISIEETPYLLLDVRDRDEYDRCHIIKSLSYPAAMICRSVNFETSEMLACRNRPGKIIVIYDEDERIAPRVADTLVERGYDNLFLLSGGLRLAYKLFPNGLITGQVPKSVIQFCNNAGKSATSQSNSVAASSIGRRSVATNVTANESTAAISSPLPPILQNEFTMQDLAYMSVNLDNVLDPSQTSSVYSRLSKSGASGKSSRCDLAPSVASTGGVDHKKPFRC